MAGDSGLIPNFITADLVLRLPGPSEKSEPFVSQFWYYYTNRRSRGQPGLLGQWFVQVKIGLDSSLVALDNSSLPLSP